MAKRKPGRFSATKAVKANARERVGQPKPAKVVDDAPRTGRGLSTNPSWTNSSKKANDRSGRTMAKAVGIGGVFLKARDPQALSQWYETQLGIGGRVSGGCAHLRRAGVDGHDGVRAFPHRYYLLRRRSPAVHAELRVDDLDGLLAQLGAAGRAHRCEARRTTTAGLPGSGIQAKRP